MSISTFPPVIIGRFQPFHLGHLNLVQQVLSKHPAVIIAVGSTQYEKTKKDPYSATLRVRCIEESLIESGIVKKTFTIVLVPDIDNDDKWVAHVEKAVPPFGDVYSGNAHVQKLFRADGKHKIIEPMFSLPISATLIREKMAANEHWADLVPPAVTRILNTWM